MSIQWKFIQNFPSESIYIQIRKRSCLYIRVSHNKKLLVDVVYMKKVRMIVGPLTKVSLTSTYEKLSNGIFKLSGRSLLYIDDIFFCHQYLTMKQISIGRLISFKRSYKHYLNEYNYEILQLNTVLNKVIL